MAKITYYTEEGYRKLKEELEHLKRVERPSISKQIAEARDKGDLSENAEYDAAKAAQGLIELKISKMEELMRNARMYDENHKVDLSKVSLLSKVTIRNVKTNTAMQYTIVAENEANLKEGKISSTSPIAAALLGHKKGEIVDVNAPAGIIQFEILEIGL